MGASLRSCCQENRLFSVIFEVHPKPEQWDAYLGAAKMLRPELEQVEGFVDNVRYRSLTREGWILSLSGWRDEKSLVRWRTAMHDHDTQQKGRDEILLDYHLRVGQITDDSQIPPGYELREQRLDETAVGEGTTISFIDGQIDPEKLKDISPAEVAQHLWFPDSATQLVAWDVYDAVLTPGAVILMLVWRHAPAAAELVAEATAFGHRVRTVRVVRDYGMFDRREAPQYYREATRQPATESAVVG